MCRKGGVNFSAGKTERLILRGGCYKIIMVCRKSAEKITEKRGILCLKLWFTQSGELKFATPRPCGVYGIRKERLLVRYFYGLAVVLGVWMGNEGGKADGGKSPRIWYVAFYHLCADFCHYRARLYYVIFSWDFYSAHPEKIFALREGGLAIYGGVIGGIATAIVFCRVQKFPLLKLLDFAMPSLLLGQIIGRWGNFANQEAFGNLITDPKLQFFPYGVFIDELVEQFQNKIVRIFRL